ncbi:Hypothetical Protein FCC1311_052522 [Hondaea fermentalgiana]|uniref:Uncharacterized protein n=1 Tax=Hondaea fermentalgiana TaxID=2315210 RepID=A0A2R5GDM4_9STRA|nr:Hypothetical Protein FCC1311_052522 [Hondaea fermentalgiana]|eukprot:GBG29030.1 Hypothetical Protein FCC1311_052522 [Hondaea fermentalgiana]
MRIRNDFVNLHHLTISNANAHEPAASLLADEDTETRGARSFAHGETEHDQDNIKVPTGGSNNDEDTDTEDEGLLAIKKRTPRVQRTGPGNLGRIVRGLPRLHADVVTRHCAVLDELGQVRVLQEARVELRERFDEIFISPLRMYLMRASDAYQERPMMPCANNGFLLDNFDHKHGYREPIRNRDRNWWEEMWTDLAPSLVPYKKRRAAEAAEAKALEEANTSSNAKVYADGVLLSKLLLLRQGAVLGTQAMVLSVYGMGIAGRIYIKPARFPRHVRIEAYCPRTRQTYSLRVNLSDLEELFADRPHLLEVGHKKSLCRALLDMVYMDEEVMQLCIARKRQPERRQVLQSRRQRREARALEQTRLERISRGEDVDGLLAQARVGTGESTGARKGKRRKPWLRLQDLVLSTVIRLSGYRLVLTVHAPARRKNVLLIRAYDQETSRMFQLIVSLRELGRRLGDRASPDLWDEAHRRSNCEAMVPMLSLKSLNVTGTEMALALQDRVGIARPGLGLGKHESRRNACAPVPLQRRFTALSSAAQDRSEVAPLPAGARVRQSTLLSRRRTTMTVDRATSRRDIGQGRLLCRRVQKISHEACIVSFFAGRGDADLVSWIIYVVRTSETHKITLSRLELEALLKHRPEIIAEQLTTDALRGRVPRHVLCDIILTERISLGPGWIPELDRVVYRRGHRLRATDGIASAHVYCVVSVRRVDASMLAFDLFERASCESCEFRFPQEETAIILEDLRTLSELERTVQLGTLIASFQVSRDMNGRLHVRDV